MCVTPWSREGDRGASKTRETVNVRAQMRRETRSSSVEIEMWVRLGFKTCNDQIDQPWSQLGV